MNPLLLWANTGLFGLAVVAWFAFGIRRFWSPLFLYLVYHLLSFVIRPWLVSIRGDQDYLHTWIGIPTTWEDHEWTIVIAALALIAFTSGSLYGENRARHRPAPRSARMLDARTAVLVGAPLVVLGFLSLIVYGRSPWTAGQESAQVVASGGMYTSVATTPTYITHSHLLLSGVFIVWILVFGFRWRYFPLLLVFFILITYQGAARTTYLVGVTALVVAHLVRNGRSRPSVGSMLPILVVLVSFISGKAWLYELVNGNREQAAEYSSGGQEKLLAGEGELFLNYEMLVTMTYLVPEHAGHTTVKYYGKAIYQFIPRALWPDKPVFDQIVSYLVFNVPEVYLQGTIATLPGEAYVAFGPAGVVVILAFFGFGMSYLFGRSLRYPAASVECVLGIAISMSCFQVYRDGLISLTTYVLFYFGPAVIVWVASLVLGTATRQDLTLDAAADGPTARPQPRPARIPSRSPFPSRGSSRGIDAGRSVLGLDRDSGASA